MDSYKKIGYIIAEALGLIEARRVHVVGSQKDTRIEHPDYLTIPATRGEPGTGKGGRPERQYHRTQSMDITRPGPHSTGGSERGKKKERVK